MKDVLAMEMLAVAAIETIAELSEGHAPRPSKYIAAFVVFFILSMVSTIGPKWEQLAAAFGGLALLAVVLNNAGGFLALSKAIGAGSEEETG